MSGQEQILKLSACLELLDWASRDRAHYRLARMRLGMGSLDDLLLEIRNEAGDQGIRWHPIAEWAFQRGMRAIVLGEPDYPFRLSQYQACPCCLFWQGSRADLLRDPAFPVAVVGTRTPTLYGIAVTRKIVSDLCAAGACIVSGLARGIDGLAHRIALEAGAPTIAVVAHGLDRIYPREHAALFDAISRQGLILTEHPPGTEAQRNYFPARNRILSGLCDAVAIMEASVSSGTMITAGFAADQGRDVYAVPSGILTSSSMGCLQLIRDGAGVILSAEDILKSARTILPLQKISAGHHFQHGVHSTDAKTETANAQCENLPEEMDLERFRLLGDQSHTVQEIAAGLGLSISETASWLTQQELNGWIVRERNRYILTDSALSCI